MFDILTIDGTGGDATSALLADLLYDDNYALESYVPGVAARRSSQLGGRGPYADVVDTLTVHVAGPTPARAYAAIEALAGLIDQAELWSRGLPVSPVLIRAHDQQSTEGQPVAAAILGWSGERPVSWPWPRQQPDGTYVIQNVALRFQRAGLWTLPPRCVNFVANWSFESDTSTTPADWANTTSGGGTAVIGSSGTPYHGAQLRTVQNSAGAGLAILYQDVTGLVNGASYRVSVWVKRTAGASSVRLTAYDGGGLTNAVTATTTSGDWARLEVTKAATAGGIRVALEASAGTTGAFDAVVLETLPASGSASPITSVDGARSSTVTSANVAMATFGESVSIPSPVRVEVRRLDASGNEQLGVLYPSMLPVVSRYSATTIGKHVSVANAADMAGGSTPAQYTSIVDGGTNSRSGNLLRYAPTGTTEVRVHATKALASGILSGAPVVFLVVKASVSGQFTVRGYMGTINVNADLLPAIVTSAPVTVSGTQRQVIALRFPEVLPNVVGAFGPMFLIGVESTAASGNFDIDSVTFVATDQHPTFVLVDAPSQTVTPARSETTLVSYLDSGIGISPAVLANTPYRLLVDPRVVSKPDGIVGVGGVTSGAITRETALSYLGTPDVYQASDTCAAVWLAPDASDWRYTLAAVVVRTQLVVTRRKAFLVPS